MIYFNSFFGSIVFLLFIFMLPMIFAKIILPLILIVLVVRFIRKTTRFIFSKFQKATKSVNKNQSPSEMIIDVSAQEV